MHVVVRLTRISPTHHRFAIMAPDGTTQEAHDLETRSCLFHDLVHFAVETEARLARSFWGRLARGVPYADVAKSDDMAANFEALATEAVVGALQGALREGAEPAAFVADFTSALQSMDAAPPPWLTVDLVVRVKERLRRLEGHWRATRFGEPLELRFELPEAPADPRHGRRRGRSWRE